MNIWSSAYHMPCHVPYPDMTRLVRLYGNVTRSFGRWQPDVCTCFVFNRIQWIPTRRCNFIPIGPPSLWLLSRLVLQDLDFSRPSFDVWSTLLCCSYLYHRSLDFGQLSRLCMGVHRGAAHISHLPRRGLDLSRGVSNRRPRHYTFS